MKVWGLSSWLDDVPLLPWGVGVEGVAPLTGSWMAGGWATPELSQSVQEGVRRFTSARGCGDVKGGIRSQFKHNDSVFTCFVDKKMFFTESETKRNKTLAQWLRLQLLTPTGIATWFTVNKHGKNPSVHPRMNGQGEVAVLSGVPPRQLP